MSYLVFSGVEEANTREAQISAALGYPDQTGNYTRYAVPILHPDNGQAALIITTVCACEVEPYWVRDAETLLTTQERASLLTYEEMQAGGWFPEDPGEEAP